MQVVGQASSLSGRPSPGLQPDPPAVREGTKKMEIAKCEMQEMVDNLFNAQPEPGRETVGGESAWKRTEESFVQSVCPPAQAPAGVVKGVRPLRMVPCGPGRAAMPGIGLRTPVQVPSLVPAPALAGTCLAPADSSAVELTSRPCELALQPPAAAAGR